MKLGIQYYPEHWPKERWAVDAAMMQRAGVGVVRMGEFAWSAYEPREGDLDFAWMDEAIELLGRHGIRTIMCTCSRTPPPWVYANYPGIRNVQPDGTPHFTDGRYRVGLAHEAFIEVSRRIDGAVIRHFAGNDNVIAWQVDNEVGSGNDCTCPRCREAFQTYLRDKYGTPEALNAAWGKHFWSFTFIDFEDVPTPGRQPQLTLEYRRFMSQVNTAFTRWRADLIRDLDPGKPVTTNFQNLYASHTDCHELATAIDVNGMNHYPSRTPELALDYYRGARGTFWAVEQHTRLRDVDTPDGRMRLWAWMTAAHGASAVVHFRWRQCRWGNEQFGDGLLPHSGMENRFYRGLSRMGAELKEVGAMIAETQPRAEVALVYDYASRWGVEVAGFGRALDPVVEAVDFHKALARRVTAVDAMDPHEDLSRYALVVAPRLWMVDSTLAANLAAFVEGGGTLCLTVGSGVVDEYGKGFDIPRPGLLSDLAGVTVSDLSHQDDLELPLTSAAVPGLGEVSASLVADEIHLDGAEVVATHAGGWRDGLPAITRHRYGKGWVVYVGVRLAAPSIDALVDWLCDMSSIPQSFERPFGVSVYERACDKYRLLFVINWTDRVTSMDIGDGWHDAFSGAPLLEVVIPANDLRILQTEVKVPDPV